MNAGAIAGILGGVIGVLGGLIGTYFSVRNAKTPAERRFMMRASVAFWAGLTAFLMLMLLLPPAWRWIPWIPYVVILPIAIRYVNRRQALLRDADHSA